MEKQVSRKKEVIISLFILLGLGLIVTQLITNFNESQLRQPKTHKALPASIPEQSHDSTKKIDPDSLWEGTEFFNGDE